MSTLDTMSTREALETLTKVTQKEDEGTQEYLIRLVNESDDKISDNQYLRLPEVVRDWLDTAIDAVDSNKTVPNFPEVEASNIINQPNQKEEVMNTATKAKPAKKATKRAATKVAKTSTKRHLAPVVKAPKKVAKKVKAVTKKVAKPTSMKTRVISMVAKNPKLSLEEVKSKLTDLKVEYKDVTVNTFFYDTHRILKIVGVNV